MDLDLEDENPDDKEKNDVSPLEVQIMGTLFIRTQRSLNILKIRILKLAWRLVAKLSNLYHRPPKSFKPLLSIQRNLGQILQVT